MIEVSLRVGRTKTITTFDNDELTEAVAFYDETVTREESSHSERFDVALEVRHNGRTYSPFSAVGNGRDVSQVEAPMELVALLCNAQHMTNERWSSVVQTIELWRVVKSDA